MNNTETIAKHSQNIHKTLVRLSQKFCKSVKPLLSATYKKYKFQLSGFCRTDL